MTAKAGNKGSISIALVGKGGAGVITAGEVLLTAAALSGYYGMMVRAVGPQIRGGESAALVRLGHAPVNCLDDRFDLLIAIDWKHAERVLSGIVLDSDSVVVTDPAKEPIPEKVAGSGAKINEVALDELAKSIAGGRVNMIALGLAAKHAGISRDAVIRAIRDKLGGKGKQSVETNAETGMLGYDSGGASAPTQADAEDEPATDRWMISGNHAAGLGALRGGIRFAAAYPITPATEILEWLAPRLHDVGGTLTQAEDELAAINMAIGASFGGVPSLTATSGPGLSLMIEGIGLSVCSEVPIVVINVMRAGPSTGIPTSSEQSDFNAAVYGLHGDAPHIVVAPNSVTDCVYTTQWAVHLAEATQSPVIVLSDQFIGQANIVADPVPAISFFAKRKLAKKISGAFERHAITADGISPMPLPGTPGGQYTADGLEHTTSAIPSGRHQDHAEQLDKRARKIADFDYGNHWAETTGGGESVILTWGSTTNVIREAIDRLPRKIGRQVKLISLRLLLPTRPKEMAVALAGANRVLVIEQNHTGQLYRFLRAWYDLPPDVETLYRPGPELFRPGEIAARLQDWCDQ